MFVPKLPKLNRHRKKSGLQYFHSNKSFFSVSSSSWLHQEQSAAEPSRHFHRKLGQDPSLLKSNQSSMLQEWQLLRYSLHWGTIQFLILSFHREPWPGYFDINKITDISNEHSLRTCTQVQRNVRKSDVVYACKKKNATEVTVSGIHDLTLWSGAFIARGPPMCSPVFLPKESSHKFAVFVNVMQF